MTRSTSLIGGKGINMSPLEGLIGLSTVQVNNMSPQKGLNGSHFKKQFIAP